MNERVRVYLRRHPSKRPWVVGPTPEDPRETYWPTWDEAMEWATMPGPRRRAQVEYEARYEMGQ